MATDGETRRGQDNKKVHVTHGKKSRERPDVGTAVTLLSWHSVSK